MIRGSVLLFFFAMMGGVVGDGNMVTEPVVCSSEWWLRCRDEVVLWTLETVVMLAEMMTRSGVD
jgi:hypothetical protein